MTLNKIKNIIKSLDPEIKENDEAYKCALVLLACVEKPHRIKDIVEFTNVEKQLVAKYLRNFRANKLITGTGRINHGGWFDEETGGLAFYCDVNVGLGYLQRDESTSV